MAEPPSRGGSAAQWERYAVLRPDGSLYVHDECDEAGAWQIALGWPSVAEIADAKRRGARAFRVLIREA